MNVDPAAASPREFYRYMVGVITPRPIAWVSTLSPKGVPNLAPFSFFNGVGANPPSVVFCPVNRRDGSRKDSLVNVEATKEFVVNIVPFALARPMNESSAELPYEQSEFDFADLEAAPSEKVKPPRVKAAPVHLECVLHDIINVGTGPLGANIVIGRIVWMHIDDGVLNDRKEVDPLKLDTIGRMGGAFYARTRDLFELQRPDAK